MGGGGGAGKCFRLWVAEVGWDVFFFMPERMLERMCQVLQRVSFF